MKRLNTIKKAIVWILLILVPIFIFITSLIISFVVKKQSIVGWTIILLFLMNPLYLALVSYGYINKKSVAFMYIALILPQLLLCLPYLTRTNDDWLAIAEFELRAGLYQIIGITVCFAIACFVKYIIYRYKKQKNIDRTTENKADSRGEKMPFIRWLLLSVALPGVVFLVFFAGMFVSLLKAENVSDFSVIALMILVAILPIYVSAVSYKFISFAKVVYMYFILIISQSIWLILLWIDREDDFFCKIWFYQIIGITVCFGIACLVKYLVYRQRVKKAVLMAFDTEASEE